MLNTINPLTYVNTSPVTLGLEGLGGTARHNDGDLATLYGLVEDVDEAEFGDGTGP